MKARFLEKLIQYRQNHRIDFSKAIISQKIEHQFAILGERNRFTKYGKDIMASMEVNNILLIEARAAREYWTLFGDVINGGGKIVWLHRKAHAKDIANQLLDIGYHYLVQRVKNICNDLQVPTELGFFHKAQGSRSTPIVYDFMEWLRPFVVDETLLHLIHKKKKIIKMVDDKLIAHFIFNIKKKFSQRYYHKRLGYCITLEYWVKILILEFVGVVNTNKIYKPIFPSLRHETRCKTCKTKPPEPKLGAV